MSRPETPYPPVERVLTGHEQRVDSRCWRPHGTPTPLLIHTRRGRALVRVDGAADAHVQAAGDTVLWLAGAMQDFTSDTAEPWEIVWAHFHPREHWHEWFNWPMLGRRVMRIPAPAPRLRARITDALLEMDSFARSGFPQASQFALNALERGLLWLDAANPAPARLAEPVQEAILFISRHLDRRLSIQEIAAAARLSPSRFAHVFKGQVGVSPAQFVAQRRIARARVLLESTSLSIGAVAETIGYSSQFYFATRFRAATGMSPSDWRRRSADSSGAGDSYGSSRMSNE